MFKIQKLDLLLAVYTFCIVVSELMGAKTFPITRIGTFQLNATVAIFVLPFIFTVNDVITEVLGKEKTRSVIRSNLFVVVLILLYSLLVTHLPPSARFEEMNSPYNTVFGVSVRFALASLTAFAIAEFLDVIVFSKLRTMLGKKNLWLRNNLSNFVSEFFDTAIFMTLAFYALNLSPASNISFILSIGIPYYLLRCFVSIIETPFVYAGVRWLKDESKSNKN